MDYEITTNKIASVLAHTENDHNWEQWHALYTDPAELPDGVTNEDTGICCHTCHVVIAMICSDTVIRKS